VEKDACGSYRKKLLAAVIGLVVVTFLIGAVSACSSPLAEGQALEDKGDLNGAIAVYRAALEEKSTDVKLLSALGADLMLTGRFNEAVPIQEKTAKLDTKDIQTRVELAFNYLNHQNRPADAVRVLTEAVKINPSAKNLSFLAQAEASNQDMVAAEATLRRAIESDPKYAFSYKLLRDLLIKLGRTEDAVQIEDRARQQGVTIP
jgi:tetratricopeptide (TPR) repeat protein